MAGPTRETMEQLIPQGIFLLTAAADGQRSGVLAHWVQVCSVDPMLIMVATPKCQPIEPLIRDSRHFALCLIANEDVLTPRKFAQAPDRNEDPFVALPCGMTPSGAPVLDRAAGYIDCRIVRHIDLETGHLMYIAEALNVELRTDASGVCNCLCHNDE